MFQIKPDGRTLCVKCEHALLIFQNFRTEVLKKHSPNKDQHHSSTSGLVQPQQTISQIVHQQTTTSESVQRKQQEVAATQILLHKKIQSGPPAKMAKKTENLALGQYVFYFDKKTGSMKTGLITKICSDTVSVIATESGQQIHLNNQYLTKVDDE